MKTRIKLILASVLVVLVLIVAALVGHQYLQRQALLQEIAAWEAAGLPLDPLLLYPSSTPEGERLAGAFIDLMAGVDEKLPYLKRDNAADYIQKYGTDEELATMRAGESPWIVVADHFAADIAELRRLLDDDTPWSWPASMLAGDLQPGIPRIYDAADLLRIEALAQAERGSVEAAAANLEAALRLSEQVELFPALAGSRAQRSIDGRVLDTLAEINQRQPIPTKEIERRLRQRNYRAGFVRGLKAQAAHVWALRDDWTDLLRGFEYDYDPRFGWLRLECQAAVYFASMQEVLEHSTVPYADQEDPGWGPDCPEGSPFHNAFLWGYPAWHARVADAEALRCLALHSFEFERHKKEVGDVEASILEADPPTTPRLGRPVFVHASNAGLHSLMQAAWGNDTIEWEWVFHE